MMMMTHLFNRMGKQELMRISKALALFRPSMIASMMNLTEADLIFTERCLQRTMMVTNFGYHATHKLK